VNDNPKAAGRGEAQRKIGNKLPTQAEPVLIEYSQRKQNYGLQPWKAGPLKPASLLFDVSPRPGFESLGGGKVNIFIPFRTSLQASRRSPLVRQPVG